MRPTCNRLLLGLSADGRITKEVMALFYIGIGVPQLDAVKIRNA
jgi:hypothetical protein